MPTMQIDPKTINVKVATLLARRQAAASPLRAMVLLKVVTNAVESAPSANRSRSRFGIRKAAVNASMAAPPPNNAAQICSRASPRTRLHITATPITPAALVFNRSVGASGATASAAIGDECFGDVGRVPEVMSGGCLEVPLVYSLRGSPPAAHARGSPPVANRAGGTTDAAADRRRAGTMTGSTELKARECLAGNGLAERACS